IPLVAWLDERGPLLAYARVTRRAVPTTTGYRLGTILGGAIEWVATDPRRYALTEQTVAATLPAPEPGLSWPLVWPLDFGTPGSTGRLSVVNAGDADAHPVIEFRGPLTMPSLTNITTGDVLEYDLPLAASDVLVVDTGAGTVVLNGTASRIHTATSRSVPEQTFTIPPGTSSFLFRAAPGSTDPTASVAVRYRAAYW
ncbi:phage distal tail protein, partial [Streptomyces echinoruber]